MNIASNWKITFDPSGTPRVLLDTGDEMAAEIRWPLKKGMEMIDLVDSANPFLRAKGNNSFSIRLEIYKDESDDATARRTIMESLIAVAALEKKPLKIEAAGVTDRYWLAGACVITEHEPSILIEFPGARATKVFAITFTTLSQVGP
jgi:hypothetical protein